MRHAGSCASSISDRQRGEVMDVYGLSDKGLRRELNEDSYIYEVNKRGDLLVCVCDGIGGSAAGEVASSLAASLLQERFAQALAFKGEQSVRRWLKQVIAEANDLIFAAASRSAARKGMGTTCVGILRSGNRTFSFNVGDSRVYALYDDGFSCVTQDHSYIADLLRKGSITAEEAKVHPARNMLTNALGVWDRIRIDIDRLKEDYQALLVCSDGLHGYVSEDTIRMVLSEDGHTAEEKARLLVQLANDMGGYDNVTVVVVQKEADEIDG